MDLNKTTQTVFRSFVEGSVLLVMVALLSTVSVTRIDPVNATATRDNQTARASLLPDINAATPPRTKEEPATVRVAPESVSSCSISAAPVELRSADFERLLSRNSHSLEILEHDGDTLIIRVLRTKCSGNEPVRLPV